MLSKEKKASVTTIFFLWVLLRSNFTLFLNFWWMVIGISPIFTVPFKSWLVFFNSIKIWKLTTTFPWWARIKSVFLSDKNLQTLCNACGIRYRRGLHPKCEQSNESYPSSSPSSSTTPEGLSNEELKQRQKEKQMKMLDLLGWNKKKNKDMNKENPFGFGTKSTVAAGSGRKEAEEAALLLMSLSSGILVH